MDGQNDVKKISTYIGKERAKTLQNLEVGEFVYDRGSTTELISFKPYQKNYEVINS